MTTATTKQVTNGPGTDLPAGIYEIWLLPSAPCASLELPVYRRVDPIDGRPRIYPISASKGELVFTLACTAEGCAEIWEHERPLLPGDLLAFPENTKYRTQFQLSYFCPRCMKSKVRSRGRRAKVDEAQSASGRRVRPRYLLNKSDAAELVRILNPEIERIPEVEKIGSIDGVREIQRGYSQKPLEYLHFDQDQQVQVSTPYCELVRYELVTGQSGSAIDKDSWLALQKRVTTLNNEIARQTSQLVLGDEKKNKPLMAKIDELNAERAQLLENS